MRSRTRRPRTDSANPDLVLVNGIRTAFTEQMRTLEYFEKTVQTNPYASFSKSALADVNPETNFVYVKESLLQLLRNKRSLEKALATGITDTSSRFTVATRIVDTDAIRHQIASIDGAILKALEFYLTLIGAFARLDSALSVALRKLPEITPTTASKAPSSVLHPDTLAALGGILRRRIETYIDSAPPAHNEADRIFCQTASEPETFVIISGKRMFGTLQSNIVQHQQKQKDELENALTPLREMLLSRMEDPPASDKKGNEGNTALEEVRRQP